MDVCELLDAVEYHGAADHADDCSGAVGPAGENSQYEQAGQASA